MSQSQPQLKCVNCGHIWLPRGQSFSLQCPECGAIAPYGKRSWGCSSWLVVVLLVVIAPVGLYLWSQTLGQRPLPAPPAADVPIEVAPPAAPIQPPADPIPVVPEKSEPKPIPEPQPAPKSTEPEPTPEEVAARDAKAAARKLSLVKPFLDRGDRVTARKRLKEIIERHGETPAADEAQQMLEKIGP